MVVNSAETHSWLPDCVSSAQKPVFGEEHIDQVREARKVLGSDIALVSAKLPSLGDLPDPTTVASIHADILTHERLSTELSGGRLPSLSVHQQSGQERAKACARALEAVIAALRVMQEVPWLATYLAAHDEASSIIEALFEKISALAKRRLIVLSSAVSVPAEVFLLGVVSEVETALDRVIAGNKPFTPFKGKKLKELFSEIMVEGHKLEPTAKEQSIKVKEYLGWRSDVESFVVTWNTVAGELGFPSVENGVGVGRWLSDVAAWTDKLRAAKVHAIPLLQIELPKLFPSENRMNVSQIVATEASATEALNVVTANLAVVRLGSALQTVTAVRQLLREHSGEIVDQLTSFVSNELGDATKSPSQMGDQWKTLLDQLQCQLEKSEMVELVRRVTELVRNSGAPLWADKICSEPPVDGIDAWTPKHWQQSWRWRQAELYLRSINKHSELKQLSQLRQQTLDILQRATNEEVRLRTTLELAKRLDDEIRSDLAMVVSLLGGMGTGDGKQAAFLRRDAQQAMERCYSAIPCWIMPSWRVSEMLPSEPYSFDLVIIDEASQSDIRELPVVLRGAKILIVGDDKQVSPSAVGIPINKIELLSHRFLKDQPFGPLMRPGFSLYDLFLAVFAGQKTMLREHFRFVEPIIRFSFQFYEQKIEPLRIPQASERLDPPLIDVYLQYGHKERNKTNPAEAEYIVEEISKLMKAQQLGSRSIGIVSLLGSHQAALINKLLLKRVGETEIIKHNIVAGDAATFQGKERDIMFVSMVSASNDFRKVADKRHQQRFNVAFSRAKDRIYLVRSLDLDDLNPEDLKAKAIMHFQNPMRGSSAKTEKARALCELKEFEREVYDALLAEGYAVTPQVAVGGYRIDMVIEGGGDRRLAVELDGEKWHGPERWWAD